MGKKRINNKESQILLTKKDVKDAIISAYGKIEKGRPVKNDALSGAFSVYMHDCVPIIKSRIEVSMN